MNLEKLLYQVNTKNATDLENTYNKLCNSPLFIENLITISTNNSDLIKTNTWLIKHYITKGNQLSRGEVSSFLSLQSVLIDWESKLHFLQIIPLININRKQSEILERFVYSELKATNKFVKASAYEAYNEITKCIPSLAREFFLLCEDALLTESASVKVKIRRILKQ